MDAEKKSRDARAWARNAIGELTVAINEGASLLASPDDKMALGYVGNMRSAMNKAADYLMRARIMLEDDQR